MAEHSAKEKEGMAVTSGENDYSDTGWSIGNITAMNNNINYTKIPK